MLTAEQFTGLRTWLENAEGASYCLCSNEVVREIHNYVMENIKLESRFSGPVAVTEVSFISFRLEGIDVYPVPGMGRELVAVWPSRPWKSCMITLPELESKAA